MPLPNANNGKGLSNTNFSYHDLERIALSYVLEDDNWPYFLEWIIENTDPASAPIMEWVSKANINEARYQWCQHSPDPEMWQLADRAYPPERW